MPLNSVLGADPEIFIKDTSSGEFVSAHTLNGSHIRGTKDKPEMVDCGAIQIDGTALEFNVNPTDCEEEWVHNIGTVMTALRERLPEGLMFAEEVTATFNPAYFASGIPDSAKQIGCDPDYEYPEMEQPRFLRPQVHPRRMAGGHIHVSTQFGSLAGLAQMDLYVGMGALTFDHDRGRLSTYGGPSAFRRKDYGFEYRTPSNAWIMSEARQRWAFRMTQRALATGMYDHWDNRDDIKRAIRSGRLNEALLPDDFEYVKEEDPLCMTA